MRILVTGGGGFVARYAAAELASHGHRVMLTAHRGGGVLHAGRRWPLLPCDLRKRSAVERLIRTTRPDGVLHLAGHSRSHGSSPVAEAFESNVLPTLELCRSLSHRSRSTTFLLSSTAFVYAPNKSQSTLDENSPVGPWTAYGASKLAAEHVVTAHESGHFHGYVTRAFNHIGPAQSPDFVCVALARRMARANAGDTIPVGNLAAVRDFSDVLDIVRAYRLVFERRPQERFFVLGSGKATRINTIFSMLLTIAEKPLSVKRTPSLMRRTDPAAILADARLARRRLGWYCRIPLDQTLREIYLEQLRQR